MVNVIILSQSIISYILFALHPYNYVCVSANAAYGMIRGALQTYLHRPCLGLQQIEPDPTYSPETLHGGVMADWAAFCATPSAKAVELGSLHVAHEGLLPTRERDRVPSCE